METKDKRPKVTPAMKEKMMNSKDKLVKDEHLVKK